MVKSENSYCIIIRMLRCKRRSILFDMVLTFTIDSYCSLLGHDATKKEMKLKILQKQCHYETKTDKTLPSIFQILTESASLELCFRRLVWQINLAISLSLSLFDEDLTNEANQKNLKRLIL